MTENTGNYERIVGVNGNLITVEFTRRVMQNEVAYAHIGDSRLKCEVIRVRGNRADLQIFESANGLKVGDKVEFTGELLSAELGPGLLTQVFDGLQNPLSLLAEHSGVFLQRGVYLRALDREKRWAGNASSPGISSSRPDISRSACAQRDVESASKSALSPIWR